MALTFLSGTDEFIGKKKKAGKKHRVAKIAMAPARAAFLEAIKLNILQLATKLLKIYKSHPSEVDNFWDKFGGEHDKLRRAVEQGSKQKIGAIALAAGVASALPIVLKAIDMFKKFGLQTPDDDKSAASFSDAAQSKLEQDPTVEKAKATLPEGEKTGKIVNDPDVKATDDNGNPIKTPFYKNPKIIIPAVIGVGLLAFGGYKLSHKKNQ